MRRAACIAALSFVAIGLAGLAPAQQASLDALAKQLSRGDGRERREAVSALAELGSEEALALVLDALADRDAMVADQAQLELGGVREPETVGELFGRRGLGASDELVRERAAELVGRLPEGLDAKPVARVLRDKEARVRRLACWSVERQAREERLTAEAKAELAAALEKLAKREKDPSVRAAAWSALWTLGALDEARLVEDVLTDEALEVRGAALVALASLPPERAVAVLAPHLADPERASRALAVRGVARAGTADAARALAAALGEESEKRLAWRIVENLRALSGLKHGRDPRPWREWAGTLPADWKPVEARRSDRSGRADPEEGETVAFSGLTLLSERLLLLVDLSGSMGQAEGGAQSRKAQAERELARTLASAPPTVRFDLVPYSAAPRPWKEALVPATPESAAQAVKHLERQSAGGPGDLWRALQVALAIPEVDSVLVFSDGAPSGGQHWNLALIGELWLEATRFRPVALDAVLVRPGSIERFWRDFCGRSGGRVLVLD